MLIFFFPQEHTFFPNFSFFILSKKNSCLRLKNYAGMIPLSKNLPCENETRIIQLENKMDYKEKNIEQLILDNKDIRKDINQLTISVTELTNTLRIREEDSRKIDELEKDVASLKSSLRTSHALILIICTMLSLGIQIFMK